MLRKIHPLIWAIVSVLVLSTIFYTLWDQYRDFLSQGQRPPVEAQILNQIEKDGIPVLQYTTISGREISLDSFKGRLIIINFWASWCDPCVAEFPSLIKLLERFKGKIEMVAVSGDYELADITNFLNLFKVDNSNIHVVWDKDLEIAKKFGTFKLPESYIIGVDGKLVRKVSGVDDWSTPDAFEYFAHLLGAQQ